MGRLNGKVALITGGAGGCGLAASELFAREGAKVALLDLPHSDGKAVAERINAAGGTALFVPTDVSVAEQVERAVAQVEERFGAITVLMNHAGTIHVGPFLETRESDWDRLMNINVKSMFLVTRAVLPKMIEAGGGSIICTSSISGVVGTPMEVLYCTTKGACHMFARAIAVEFSMLQHELQMLPDRHQAILNLGLRSGAVGLKRLSAILAQTMAYGTPLVQGLRAVANELRRERMIALEAKAARLPALLVLPMILFIMPCLFIVLMGPLVVRLMDALNNYGK